MDVFEFIDIPLWSMLLICGCILLYIYGSRRQGFWVKLGIPTPPSAPFIGHMHKMFNPNIGMRVSFENWSQRYGNIFGVLFFTDPLLIVKDLDALKEILVKDFNNYADRYFYAYNTLWQPLLMKGVFFNKGQDWKRIRKIMTPSFSSGKLRLLTHHINTTARQLADTMKKNAEMGTHPEAKAIFSAFSLDVIAGTAFSLDLNSQNNSNGSFYQHAKSLITFKESLKFVLAAVSVFPALGGIFKLLRFSYMSYNDVEFFETQLTKLVSQRKENPDACQNVDFLQFLINAEAEETEDLIGSKKLTTEEIVAQGIVFIIAGYETTSTALQWIFYELARNPEVQVKMKNEIDSILGAEEEVTYEHCQKLVYMEAVINESLRMYPPLVIVSRRVKRDTVLKGYNVPAKTGIFIPIYNICRDPESFENPNTFNPDRFLSDQKNFPPIAFLPFGFGPRQCIGLRIAMMVMKIALVHAIRAVTVESTIPEVVEVDDFTGIPIPKEVIKLVISPNNRG